jgi:cation transport regulator
MRYETINDLPETLQATLPEEAQKLYIETYNQVWDEYDEIGHDGNLDRDGVAHQAAWRVVDQEFVQQEGTGRWYRRGEVPSEEDEEEKKGLLDRLKDAFTGG